MKLPLIVFLTLLFSIIFFKWRANRPKKPKLTETKETPPTQKKEKKNGQKSRAAWIFIIVIAISICSLYWYQQYFSKTKPQPVKQVVVKKTKAVERWQLCWEKLPEYKGTTKTRSKCLPARIKMRNESYILISYSFGKEKGVQSGSSSDGVSYSGRWKDSTGWGRWHLRFVSSGTAFGWSDKKGDGRKQPNVLEKM